MKLRDYQVDCGSAVITNWKTGDAQLVVMPTGTGKTVVFLSIADEFLRCEPDKKVLIIWRRSS
jgi:superfamily II DNA or RNA helicase